MKLYDVIVPVVVPVGASNEKEVQRKVIATGKTWDEAKALRKNAKVAYIVPHRDGREVDRQGADHEMPDLQQRQGEQEGVTDGPERVSDI